MPPRPPHHPEPTIASICPPTLITLALRNHSVYNWGVLSQSSPRTSMLARSLALPALRSIPAPCRSHFSALSPRPFRLTHICPIPSPRPRTQPHWSSFVVPSQPRLSSPAPQKIRLSGRAPLHPLPISTLDHPPSGPSNRHDRLRRATTGPRVRDLGIARLSWWIRPDFPVTGCAQDERCR